MALLAAYTDNQLLGQVLWVAGSKLLVHMIVAKLCLPPKCGPGWAVHVPTDSALSLRLRQAFDKAHVAMRSFIWYNDDKSVCAML